jgi:hypothetical protein
MRQQIAEAEFPDSPGVYVVWDEGQSAPLYIGVAATQTIKQRWRKQTLQDRAGGSALRRTLGVHLGLVERKLSPTRDGTRYYAPEVEEQITRFLLGCEISFHPCCSPEESRELEETLVVELAPRLNVRRPRIKRTRAEKAVLREAALFFRERVKPAVLEGLRASNHTAVLDSKSYVVRVEDNLLPGIELSEIRAAFDAAPGHELESKMRAPWSSSALGVNAFAPWIRQIDRLPLADRIGFETLEFERACSNNVSRFEPHLDILLKRPSEVVGVESKFTEYLQGSDHPPVAEGYKRLADKGDFRADSRWFAALEHVERFLLLDAYQLVKHYLGMTHTFREQEPQLTLVYLYWEPTNPTDSPGDHLFALHRAEIAEFAQFVAGDPTCKFVALSYAEHWRQLEEMADTPLVIEQHLEQLWRRYVVTV